MSGIGCKQFGTGFLVCTYQGDRGRGDQDTQRQQRGCVEQNEREEVLVKIELDQTIKATDELASNTRRSGRTKIANR